LKFIVASNAFKGSLSSEKAALAVEKGLKICFPEAEIVKLLVADGGDGFIDALRQGLSAETYKVGVTGPQGNPLSATFLYVADTHTAIIEMAAAAGLALLSKKDLDPMKASTIGVGELIEAALGLGVKHIILGIGGSATNDGGTGMASALGVRFLDEHGYTLIGNAENLNRIVKIDCSGLDSRLQDTMIEVACDVNNLLLGECGAAAVYGPQKGASIEQIKKMEKGLNTLANVIKKDLHIEVRDLPGGGAAGGLGMGLFAFLNATLRPGAELLLDMLQFDEKIQSADLVITTEGKLDWQTGFGKAPSAVAKRSIEQHVPCIAIVGQIGVDSHHWASFGFTQVHSLCSASVDIPTAMNNTATLLTKKTVKVIGELFSP